jgi:protein-S-isoprenylcysteine O-methyltransferase Ste14
MAMLGVAIILELYNTQPMRYSLGRAYAWIGAGLFVGSLLYFLYFYLIGLDRPAAGGGLSALAVDLLLFSAFALHHSIMARTGAKQWLTRFVPAELERSTYVWIASLLFLATCAWWQPVGGVVYDIGGLPGMVLRFIQAGAVILVLVASAALSPLELAGLRPARAAAPPEKPDASRTPPPSLCTTGVYGWVRHPVYLGWILFVFTVPRMTTDRLLFAIVSTTYLAMAVPFEERSLVEAFGEHYRRYSRRVRWKIVPWIY